MIPKGDCLINTPSLKCFQLKEKIPVVHRIITPEVSRFQPLEPVAVLSYVSHM